MSVPISNASRSPYGFGALPARHPQARDHAPAATLVSNTSLSPGSQPAGPPRAAAPEHVVEGELLGRRHAGHSPVTVGQAPREGEYGPGASQALDSYLSHARLGDGEEQRVATVVDYFV